MIAKQIVKLKNGENVYLILEKKIFTMYISAFNLNNELVGECYINNFKNKEYYPDEKCHLFLLKITNEKYFNQGLGHSLLSYVENYCIANNCYQISGAFHPLGKHGCNAKNFYISHGYTIAPEGNHQIIFKALEKRQERNL